MTGAPPSFGRAPRAALPVEPESRPLLAAAWMTGAIASFSAMAVAGRAVSLDHDTFEIMLYRSLIGLGIVLVVAGAWGRLGEVTTRHMGLHAIRNCAHFAGQNLWFFALPLIPLAQLFSVEFTSPIWATLLAPLVLGERLTRARVLAALLGFAGVLVVARPDFGTLDPGILAAAGAALGFAGSALFTRKLTRTETVVCILFWLSAMQAVLGLAFAGLDGDIALPSAGGLPWLGLIALSGLCAHYCLTTALSLAPAGVVMTMDFLRLPVIAVVGMVFYGEPLELAVVLGAALVLGANWINIRRG
ncbi:MAG: Permeases of the drug/metabolite transporter (DMT) superfamily [Rhodobacteraceae bacterium HLUCCA09]|nr:MAG: Permeases of the drug/metabolite transporter (DMT) superfamily [Rhodobacteraceae bacterium HLUCCA09]